jgi:Holliday junction resolvase RusA-like endonuclease
MKYILKGKPIAWKRPKRSTKPFPHSYDSQKAIKAESALELRLQRKNQRVLSGPLTLNITFFMPIPKSTSKKKRLALIGQPHIKRPDLDNLIKYTLDVAQDVHLFTDDSEIATIKAKKIYDTIPRTEFTLTKENHDAEH